MSMNSCHKCGDVYDTDFQMETDKAGNMICDRCFEGLGAPAADLDPAANPCCDACRGTGRVAVNYDGEVDFDICECLANPEADSAFKRFRLSIYIDCNAYTEERAKIIGEKIAEFLGDPEADDPRSCYHSPYFGGAAWLVKGDLLGNSKRLDKI